MDGVIADVATHLVNYYFDAYRVKISPQSLDGKSEADVFLEKGAVNTIVRTPGFFRTLPVMSGAVEAVMTLMMDFDIFIVSAAMEFPNSLAEKKEWLTEHFPYISWRNIIFCGDKSIVRGDYMIDDHCKNLDLFDGKAILFHAGHNIGVAHHWRAKNWQEVLQFLKECEAGNDK